jgi:hypothetical protein
MADNAPTCFVIGPIGDREGPVRTIADQVLKYVITPEATRAGYEVIRADKISEPGLVTRQIMGQVINASLVIADLTGRNPNVYYELAVRHAIRKPLIQLLTGEDTLPFDIYDTRTIIFDIRDLDSVEGAKHELGDQLAALAEGPKPAENPIAATLDLEAYRDSGDVGLTQVLSALADLRAEMSSVRARLASTAERVSLLGKGATMRLGEQSVGNRLASEHLPSELRYTPDNLVRLQPEEGSMSESDYIDLQAKARRRAAEGAAQEPNASNSDASKPDATEPDA